MLDKISNFKLIGLKIDTNYKYNKKTSSSGSVALVVIILVRQVALIIFAF